MVAANQQIGTRMLSRIDAYEENIEFLSSQVKELTVSMNLVKEVLGESPKTMNKMVLSAQFQHGKELEFKSREEESPFA